jgi:hypothetical protein
MCVYDLFQSRTKGRGGGGRTRGVDDGAGLDLGASGIFDDLLAACQCRKPVGGQYRRVVGDVGAAAVNQIINQIVARETLRRNARSGDANRGDLIPFLFR